MNKEKKNIIEFEKIIRFTNDNIKSSKRKTIEKEKEQKKESKKIDKKIKIIIIAVSSIIGIIIIATIVGIFFGRKCKECKEKIINFNETSNQTINYAAKIESEFEFNNKVGDLRRISIIQKTEENRIIDGEHSNLVNFRNTTYDIYIFSEEKPNKEYENYYNTKYLASISIAKECFIINGENCEQKELIDLTSNANSSELRNLEEKDDLKDIPLPFCLFNLTNNDVITSISCPKSLDYYKKKKIVLDLYFFRPPGIKRQEKEAQNVTINIKTENGKTLIRETNGNICDIDNAHNSFCTTDMNTTTDIKGNILSYKEEAVMIVQNDENNSYEKIKNTYLEDITNKNMDPIKYNKTLEKFMPLIKRYLEYDELFSKDNFQEYLEISREGSKALRKRKLNKKNKRKLSNENINIERLFNILHIISNDGYSIDYNLINNGGIGRENMEANNGLKIERKEKPITICKKSSFNINQIIDDLVSIHKAGNHLASILFQKTNSSLEDMTESIDKSISFLNSLVKYEDISQIFATDNDVILPFVIIEESENIKNKLHMLLKEIENEGIKKNLKFLKDDIYNYLDDSHNILNSIFDNLNELKKALNSDKNQLTEISTYYLNNTSTSYASTIEKALSILYNYYKDEKDLILYKVDFLIKNFEKKFTKSIEGEIKILDILSEKIRIKNYTIELENEDDLKKFLNNIYDIKTNLNEIKKIIIAKIKKEMNLKDNGYFTNEDEINKNNISYSDVIESALETAKNLDNDQYIDTVFDEIMVHLIDNFTNIQKFMDKKKESLFPINEDVLIEDSFSPFEKENMKVDINTIGVSLLNEIRHENEDYLAKKNKIVDEFLNNCKDKLLELYSYIDLFFSEEKIEELAYLYDVFYYSYLNTIKKELKENKVLAYDYLDNISKLVTNNTAIINLLNQYHTDEEHLVQTINYKIGHVTNLTSFEDSIQSKYKTQGYKTKYETFVDSFEKSRDYINNQLFYDLLSEYKLLVSKLKELLQKFKNNKISNKYIDFDEISFIDENIKNIEPLYNRINKSISDEIFNQKYIEPVNNFKIETNKELNTIKKYIKDKNTLIDTPTISEEYTYDFCLTFLRKKTYTCENGCVGVYEDSDEYCFPETKVGKNYMKLIAHSMYSDDNYKIYKNKFNEFYNLLNDIISNYTSIINELKESLLSLEEESMNNNYTLNYFSQFDGKINSLLSEKYGDKLISNAYHYYQKNIKELLEPILNDISKMWSESYTILYNEIKNNITLIKGSIKEFNYIAQNYITLISYNITKNYFNSIVYHQKNEFNYTISYYYNILLKIINSIHQDIINKTPTNKKGFNNIMLKRKNEVNYFFINLKEKINKSLNNSLSLYQQIKIIDSPDTNFFNINDILENNIFTTEKSLESILERIKLLNNNKYNNQYTLSARFYLENSLSGKQINELYEQINQKVFVYLDLDKFKELLIENWIFDQDEFINKLNEVLYNSNLEIEKEFLNEKEKYIKKLKYSITQYYTKEELVSLINELYKDVNKNLFVEQKEEIKINIIKILNNIANHFSKEAQRLRGTSTSYNKDLTKINDRLRKYKEKLFISLNQTIFFVINDFYKNMTEELYHNYIERNLKEYISESQKYNDHNNNEEKLLNCSFKISEIMLDIVYNLVYEYQNISKKTIDLKYNEYYLKIKKEVDLDALQILINDEIDDKFNSILLPALNEFAIHENGIDGFKIYDLNDTIIEDIDSIFNSSIENIKSIINSTKGNNYVMDKIKSKIFDFSSVYELFFQIDLDFKEFIYNERNNEEINFDEYLQNIIKNNFNNLLNNVIPSFGNKFFERIIKYNENFKISSLYDNLKYSLAQTLSYYLMVYSFKQINSLTSDLKSKIFSLNNLDFIVQTKNDEVLNLLEDKVNNFIENSKDYLIEKYKLKLTTDESIQMNFNQEINNKILKNFNNINLEIENDYSTLMNKFFKEQLISSYKITMNEKKDDMIRTIQDQRETLKSFINDLFTLKPEAILEDINNKMNNTLKSINLFNTHFNTFKISENINNFLYNYGTISIKPYFDKIISIYNEVSKNIIDEKVIERNIKDYEKILNKKEFEEETNKIYKNINYNYLGNINKTMAEYGIDEDDYYNKLIDTIDIFNKRNLRRLEDILTEEDKENIAKERISDKAIDNIFNKLYISSSNAKRFINSLEKFNEFENIINDNINSFNTEYKASLKRILDCGFDNEKYNLLKNKTDYIKNFTLDYYNSINNDFLKLKNYLKDSINDINININKCSNITTKILKEIYFNIKNKMESFEEEYSGKEEEPIIDHVDASNQNKVSDVEYTITNNMKRVKFKYNVEMDDNYNNELKVNIGIENQSRPENIKIKIINPIDGCIKTIEEINIPFNNVNYTMNVGINTSSTDLLIDTSTNLDSYQYSKEYYQIEGEKKEICYNIVGVKYCYSDINCDEEHHKVITSKKFINVERIRSSDSSIIHKD